MRRPSLHHIIIPQLFQSLPQQNQRDAFPVNIHLPLHPDALGARLRGTVQLMRQTVGAGRRTEVLVNMRHCQPKYSQTNR